MEEHKNNLKPFTSEWWGEKALQAKTIQEWYEKREGRTSRDWASNHPAIALYCIKRALKAARREGFREGYRWGRDKGFDEGLNEGYVEGYDARRLGL